MKPPPYYTGSAFEKKLDPDWFVTWAVGASDPAKAYQEWEAWLGKQRQPTADSKFRKVLQLALHVTPPTVSHYIFRQRFPEQYEGEKGRKLAPQTIRNMDMISLALGMAPLVASPAPPPASKKGIRRIALLAELGNVPSPRYHVTVLAALVRAAEINRNFAIEIHDVAAGKEDLCGRVARILRNSSPDAVAWFRVTPDAPSLAAIANAGDLPVVLIHAARLRYPAPVIAHVVPRQQPIEAAVDSWARDLAGGGRGKSTVVAIGAMKAEEAKVVPYPAADPNIPVSLRAERVALIEAGVRAAGLEPRVVQVDDYSARRAWGVIDECPDARGYIMLSDEMAVAAAQLLTAKGEEGKRRVLGFDGSKMAEEEGIPSFNQQLPELGEKVMRQFQHWFDGPAWSGCKEIEIGLRLARE